MQNLRVAAGVGLLAGLWLILISGFVVTSGREMSLVLFGFASGLVAVYLLERIKALHAARH
ncbi:MAG TPA: hypothetical protein GX714_04965 [Chloroflexi bacterium]|jgi:hypothetical protein|nr:hypothetical protein [Chloroflexota bacterium]